MTGSTWLASLLFIVPDAWPAFDQAWRYSPIAIFAGAAAASTIYKAVSRQRPVAANSGDPDELRDQLWDGLWGDLRSDAGSLSTAAPGAAGPAGAVPATIFRYAEPANDRRADAVSSPSAVPQGADLAARARFVAMTFAACEPGGVQVGSAPFTMEIVASPLDISCRPTRFTVTPRHAALRYSVQLGNRGAQALGPLIIRADLAAIEPGIPQDRQADFDPDELSLCHYVDSLAAGGDAELTGELRLSLGSIAAIRLGTAELLLPLMRIGVESAGGIRPSLSWSECFAIGIQAISANNGIQPFHLDAGLGIWRNLTARRLKSAVSDSYRQLALDGGQARG